MQTFINQIRAVERIGQMKKKVTAKVRDVYATVKKAAFTKFSLSLLSYGLACNIPMHIFLDKCFTPFTIIAYGIIFYFMTEELPRFLYKIRGTK